MNEPIAPNRATLFDAIIPELPAYRKAIFVRNDKFDLNRIPAKGTTIKNSFLNSMAVNCDGAMDWVFSHAEPHRTDGWHAFYFVQPRTGSTAATPVLTHGDSESFTWPEVLKKIKFDANPDIPLTTTYVNTATSAKGVALLPRWFVQIWRRKQRGGHWPIRVNHYIGSEPFAVGQFVRNPPPDPGEIQWDLAGHSYEMTCLHKKEMIPVQSGRIATLVSGVLNQLGGDQEEREFPATRMTDWSEFTFYDYQRFIQGVWHRMEGLIQPPDKQKIVPETLAF